MMEGKVTTMTDWKKRAAAVGTWLCLWLPAIGTFLKGVFLQMFISGADPYTPDVWAGLGRVLPYLPLHAAVLWLIFGWGTLFRGRGRHIWNGVVYGLTTFVAFIDVAYLRAYSMLPSVSMLTMLGNSAGRASIVSTWPTLVNWWDLLFVADILLWAVLMIVCRPKAGKPRRRVTAITLGASVLALCVVPLLALCGVRAPYRQLHKTADTLHRAQYFSYMGFHLGDIAATAVGHQPHIDAEDEALLAAYRAWQAEDTTVGAHTGALEGKNLIVIQVESLESFVLGKSIDGQEITPTLNRLMTGGYTFSNIYEQVKGGNSSDCDFLLMTGLLPIDSNYVFGTHADEPYLSLQTVLKERAGYTSYYFHGGTNSSWNYEDMLRDGIRVQHIDGDYVQDEILNDYVSDESFFRQTAEKLAASPMEAPFYAHITTCSSHIPCHLPEELRELTLDEELAGNPMGRYLQVIRYADTQIGMFLDELEKQGVLENTAVVIVGDHGGVNKYYPHFVDDLDDALREDWFPKAGEKYTVPFIVHCPSALPTEAVDTIGGQVDVMPTLLGLLGVRDERLEGLLFGRDLLATKRSFAVTSNGEVYGTLSEADAAIAKTAFYLSDLLIRGGRVGGQTEVQG